ncbi:MAG: ABC-2 family transporter protein [Planctomycetota bacterium]|nr:ABC-2 family transporter protein [Planctomycetota bacterium]
MRQVRIFFAYFAQYAMRRLAYKGDFFAEMFAGILGTAATLAFVLMLFYGAGVQAIGQWSREQVLFIYGFTFIPFGLFNVLSLNLYQFSERYIIEGRFDRVLVRPLGTLPQVMFESFRLQSLHEVAVGLVIITLCAREMGTPLDAGDYGLIALMGLGGFGVLMGVFLILVSASFWFEDRIGIAPPVYNLIMFGRYPIDIYHQSLQFILKWIVPFGFIGFYPSARFIAGDKFGGDLRLAFLLTPVVGLFCLVLAFGVWTRGVRRYSSTGS